MTTAVEITGLTKNYGAFRALDDLSLKLPAGKIVGLLGENGCGKTTLLKAVLAGAMKRSGPATSPSDGHRSGRGKAIVSFLPEQRRFPG